MASCDGAQLQLVPWRNSAQATRISFAASATTTLLPCARASRPRSQAPSGVGLLASGGKAARAPWMINLRKYLLPRLVIPSSFGLPPVVGCRGTRSSHAARSRPRPFHKGGRPLDPQGFDAGKKVTGRKRHILVDALGLLLNVVVHSADLQDPEGARLVLDAHTRRLFPFIELIFTDAGYQGAKAATAAADTGRWTIEIVKRTEAHSFVVLPKRWIVNACTMLPGSALFDR